MKKFVMLLLALAVAGGAVSAYAGEKPESPVGVAVLKSAKGFRLFYKGMQAGDVRVTIYNARHEMVFTEIIRDIESFVRPYNLSMVGPGEYVVELDSQEGKKVEHVTYEKRKVFLSLLPIAGETNKYILSLANKTPDVLNISVFGESNELLYSHREEVSGDFAKVYTLKNVPDRFSFHVTGRSGLNEWISHSADK